MIQFGTGGWRAVIGEEFTRSHLELLSAALADKMIAEGAADRGIVIGYDRRFLSKEAMQWMAQVFAAKGIPARLINKSAPTPLAMYYVMAHRLPYGLMVTASHNPAIYNGVKVFTAGGRDAEVAVTEDIEKYARAIADSGQPIPVLRYEEARKRGLIEEIYPINEYLDSILSVIDTAAIRRARLRVILDPMYGVSETAIKTLLISSRCEVDTINGQHDPLFGGKLPAPSEKALRNLSYYVDSYGYDIGIATDGDADRIGVVDNNGRYLSPNDILIVLYYYLVKYKGLRGPVVRNLCTTHVLDRLAEMFGEHCYEVPVGFKHISAKMTETDALIGGESSGGLSIKGHIHGKDGVYAAALLVEMLAVTGKKMSEIFDEIRGLVGDPAFLENNYGFLPEQKPLLLKLIMEDKRLPELPFAVDHVSYPDGCKVYFKNGGWVSVRFSGTEPLLRIFAEMPDREAALSVSECFRSFLGI